MRRSLFLCLFLVSNFTLVDSSKGAGDLLGGNSSPKESKFKLFSDTLEQYAYCIEVYMADDDELVSPSSLEEAEQHCEHLLDKVSSAEADRIKDLVRGDVQASLKEKDSTNAGNLFKVISEITSTIDSPNYNIQILTSAAASLTLWTIFRNPRLLAQLAAKRMNPAMSILPPNIVDEIFSKGTDTLIIPSHKDFSESFLFDFLNLERSQQLKILNQNPDLANYLYKVADSLKKQKKYILMKKGLLV